jgi:hypothetical protein
MQPNELLAWQSFMMQKVCVTSLLDLWLLGSLLLGCSDVRLLQSLLFGRSDLWPCRPCSGHLLVALVVQSLKKGLLSLSGGQRAF